MADDNIPRRSFLVGAGVAGTAAVTGVAPSPATAAPEPAPMPAVTAQPEAWLTLNPTEAAFAMAAVDTLIPADDLTPSGSACGVATFIDRQLAGAYGSGARLYRDGPFLRGKPEHGYQLALTPRDYFRAGIAATNDWTRKRYGKDFDRLGEAEREAALKELEQGKAEFPGFSSKEFFEALLTITMEGFFADPIYGGNRGMAAWKMVGYPGLPASYRDDMKAYFNKKYDKPSQSISDFV
jgi:gluconate 2-dehydrogenase gamma chain